MKKTILIIGLTIFCLGAFAQKKEYTPDPNTTYKVTLNLTMFQLTALIESINGTLKHNPQYKGDQIEALENELPFIKRVIAMQVNEQNLLNEKKFQADTAAIKKATK